MKKLFLTAVSAALVTLGAGAGANAQEAILGEMRILPYTFCPQGWALADGSLIAISQNDALFSIYGTTYGGDGITTFALPDMRGRMAMNHGQGPGLTPRVLGQRFGQETVTLTLNEMPRHNHTLRGTSAAPNSRSLQNASWGDFQGTFNAYTAGGALDQTARGDAVSVTGGSQAHQNIQPVLVLRHCVAMFGVYPPRN
jgi:microcystin-dependent protein